MIKNSLRIFKKKIAEKKELKKFKQNIIVRDKFKNKENKKFITIAHAGGNIKGIPYTNSLEALKKSLEKGIKYIEVDIAKYDNEIILMHDLQFLLNLANLKVETSFEKLKKEIKKIENLTIIKFDDLICLLEDYNDVIIILDTPLKFREDILKEIIKKYKDKLNKMIIQISKINEYNTYINMGFDKIIFNIGFYHENRYLEEALNYMDLYGISISNYNYFRDKRFYKSEKYSLFIHTVNNEQEKEFYRKNGISGIYTD